MTTRKVPNRTIQPIRRACPFTIQHTPGRLKPGGCIMRFFNMETLPTMTASPTQEFFRGIKESSPMLIGLLPWALILGVQGGQKGMSWAEMMLMTGMNFAGGSEFAAVDLWTHPLPVILIATVTLMINSRHILMGAALAPYMNKAPMKKVLPALFFMCDESWAMGLADAQKRKAAASVHLTLLITAACVLSCILHGWRLRHWARRSAPCSAMWRLGASAWRFRRYFWYCCVECGKALRPRALGLSA